MSYNVCEIFSIGIGPSSSHTVGPMRAAYQFLQEILSLRDINRIQITLYGSLAHTGKGHGTHTAVLMGLEGEQPETIVTANINKRFTDILRHYSLLLLQQHPIHFDFNTDFIFDTEKITTQYANTMEFCCYNSQGEIISQQTYFSIGGGFIEEKGQEATPEIDVKYPFQNASELSSLCQEQGLTIEQIMFQNQLSFHATEDIAHKIVHIEQVMKDCIDRGINTTGTLPGPSRVQRRAAEIHQKAIQHGSLRLDHPDKMNWLNLYALAVNEENAVGNRVVTAPTNGAAGIIPAITQYHRCCDSIACDATIVTLFLTAAAICVLYKTNASISGAEMGCQGEVGVACSMAAAGLTAARGGTLIQIEKAAEIAMEHNLGLTCDPVGGQVQIPCIERNGMGAVKAVNASSLALINNQPGKVSLDAVINTMREIGQNMSSIYKETSKGGLTVNITEC